MEHRQPLLLVQFGEEGAMRTTVGPPADSAALFIMPLPLRRAGT